MVEPLERPLSSYIHTQFVTADENSSVAEAVKILQPKNVEIILVTSSNGKYVGIVTDSDILEKVVMKGEDSDLVFLKSIMTSPIITLPSSSTVRQAIQLMRAHKIKHLPVTDSTNNNDEGKIIGCLTQTGGVADEADFLMRTFSRPACLATRSSSSMRNAC